MKYLTGLIIVILVFTLKVNALKARESYCSSFLKNVKQTFGQGIQHIENSQHHFAYDSFGETLTRIRAESKYLEDCEMKEKEKILELKEKSAHTLTALRGQMK